jgi:uncharacterized protein (TIGR02145 family)
MLKTVCNFSLFNNSTLVTLTVPLLSTVCSLYIAHVDLISSLSFPELTTSTDVWSIYGCNHLSSISIDKLAIITSINISDNKLTTNNINYLLNKFVTITPYLTNKYINLGGNNPTAPPTGQGIIDKATLIVRGNTVATDEGPIRVSIGNQVWMQQNLDVATYRNGNPIPKVTDAATWASLTTGAYCYFNNDSASYASIYGKLYNWHAVNDPRGLAPLGWHIPTDAEWTKLTDTLGGTSVAGGKMKEAGTLHWPSPNTGATNSSEFTGLPGGYRNSNGAFDLFSNNFGFWWTSSQLVNPSTSALERVLQHNANSINRGSVSKNYAFSVRCVKD